MAKSGNESLREQHNHGSGLLIGRDNYGEIRYEMLDPKTKTVLAKLSKDAPDLAKLLTRALRDGIISPNVVAALESAVRNINEDVATALMLAGQNINKDVADEILEAADTLREATNEAADTLREARNGLNPALPVNDPYDATDLDHLVGLVSTITGAAERIERVVAPPPPRVTGNWWASCKVFFWGVVAGFAVGAFLIFYLIKR